MATDLQALLNTTEFPVVTPRAQDRLKTQLHTNIVHSAHIIPAKTEEIDNVCARDAETGSFLYNYDTALKVHGTR